MATDPEREKALEEYKKKLLERKEVKSSWFLKLALLNEKRKNMDQPQNVNICAHLFNI